MNLIGRRRRGKYGAFLITGCVALSAFGTAATASAKAKAKAPIKVFVYGDETVPAPTPPETFLQDIPAATVKAINASGGINGAKIQMTFCDSKFDPNTTTACVKKAISGHYAAIIVPTSSVGQGGADQLLAKSGLPVFYAIPNNTQIAVKNAVCPTSTILGSGAGVGWMAKALGVKKLSLADVASPTFEATGAYVKASLSKAGVAFGNSVTEPIGTPDWSSGFAQAMAGGATGLWYANLPPILDPSLKQFLSSNSGDKVFLQYLAYNTLSDVGSAGDGALYFPSWTQPISSHVPGVNQFVETMKKYAADPGVDINDSYISFYLPMKLFAQIAKTIKGTVNEKSVLTAIKTAKNVSMGGLIPNYSGSERGKAGAPCIYQNTIVPTGDNNGQLINLHGSSFLNTANGKLEAS